MINFRTQALTSKNINNKEDKINTLRDICLKLGFKYTNGAIGFSDNKTLTQKELTQNLQHQILLLNHLKKCHVLINENVITYTNNSYNNLLEETCKLFTDLKIDNPTNTAPIFLALVAHREDGKWYKFQKSHSSYAKHANLLNDFLQTNIRRIDPSAAIYSRSTIRQNLNNINHGNIYDNVEFIDLNKKYLTT